MPSQKRIMLVEASPRVVQSKAYATLNPADKYSSITLSGGNLIATRGAGGVTYGIVRGTVALIGRSTYWETQRNSGTARAGICTSAQSLTGTLGTGTTNVAGPDASGNCVYNGVTTATVGAVSTSDIIGHWYDAGSGLYRVRKNNGAWQTVNAKADSSRVGWFPCIQLNASSAMRIGFGSAFTYAAPAGVSIGVFTQADPATTTVYFSSDKFNTFAADTPSNTHYFARIKGGSDVVISRSVRSWLHGSNTSSSRGTLTVLNGDRRLDAWNDYVWRDAKYTIYAGYEGDARSAFTVWAAGVIDDLSWDNEGNLILALADPLARLERSIQTALYPDDAANAQIANTGKPIALGRPLYCQGVLLSTATTGPLAFAYDVHDDAVQFIASVYDKGDVFAAPPTDWDYLPARTGAKLVNLPDNPVVINPQGAMESGTDYLATIGSFIGIWTGSPSTPPGWSQGASSGGVAGLVTNALPGARYQSNGAGIASLNTLVGFLPGVTEVVRIDVMFTAWSSGQLSVRLTNFGASFQDVVFAPSGPGMMTIVVTRPAAQTAVQPFSNFTACDYTVGSIRITPVTLIERLPAWIKYLCVTKGPLTTGDLDTTAINALDAAAPYRLAKYISSGEQIKDVLAQTMDSFCGWITTNRMGQITVGRMQRPTAAPTLILDKSNIRSIRPSIDLAKGFTTRLAGRFNNRVHSDSEIVTSATPALRAELSAEWGSIKTAYPALSVLTTDPNNLMSRVKITDKHAESAPPQPTLLQEPDDLQAEINRVADMRIAGDSMFVEIQADLDAATADALELGIAASVTYPIQQFDSPRTGVLLDAEVAFHRRSVSLLLLILPEA
ncbi:MAG: hypothetical protein ABIR16_01650 [Dokdonella sp.]